LTHAAVDLNFIDVYHRTGTYPIADSPFLPGLEAAGTVTELGPDVTEFSVGDRVAYAGVPIGAYCDERIIPVHSHLYAINANLVTVYVPIWLTE